MKEDPFFNDFDVYVYSFSSLFNGSSYTIDELVEDIRRDLDRSDIFQKHKNVIFLCHSMGGVVVRAFLTRYQTRASKVPLVYFFSTPTTGTQMAILGRLLSTNSQLKGMLPIEYNDYLASIQKNWLAANFPIASYCAYETQDTYGVRVVEVESATNLCNRRLDPINANHIDIVKPRDRSDAPYVSFQEAVREFAIGSKSLGAQPKLRKPPTNPSSRTSPILVKPDLAFTIVNPAAPGLILWPLHSVALNVKADPLLWDIDREDKGTDSLLVNEAKYDWIRPDQHGGPTGLLHPNDVQNVVKPGHRIVGYITIACPDCERVLVCWVYFVCGQNGWFMDTSSRGGPNPARLADSIPALRLGDPEQFLSSFPEWANRNPILPKP